MSAKELQALTQKFADAFDQRDLQPILDMLSEDVEVLKVVTIRFISKLSLRPVSGGRRCC
jgi:ketosteroid isomerase-like protein